MNVNCLLPAIDAALGDGPRAWSDVVVVRNVGPLQTASPLEGDLISNRGFNALVFSGGDLPTHFLKVRPAVHRQFHAEAEFTARLSESAGLTGLVPSSTSFVVGPARVLAEAFIDGPALDLLIRTRHRRDWAVVAADVIRAADPMWDAIASIADRSALAAGASSTREQDLDVLRPLGLTAAAAQGLARCMDALPDVAQPQHGDFWPRNVLKGRDGWKVLDFESCGTVKLPLYDVFHMIRGCGEAASGGKGRWLEQWAACGAGGRRLAAEVRRASSGMETAAIEGALIAYLVEFAARLHRRGIARERFADRLQELSAMPELLATGLLRTILE